jgi:hypothetical protein
MRNNGFALFGHEQSVFFGKKPRPADRNETIRPMYNQPAATRNEQIPHSGDEALTKLNFHP